MNSKVSIIIPCFNDAAFIEMAIESARAQNIQNKEIIVVDDGSNLQTKEILNNLRNKVDLIITQENNGVSAARNTGIQRSTGDFILVLDSDDYFEPDFCKKALNIFETQKNICLVTCYARWFDEKNNFKIHKPIGGDLNNFLFRNCALSNSMFYKKDWKSIGGYDESMKLGWEDWEFFIRLHKKNCHTYVIPEVLFNYRRKKNSKTTVANLNKYDLLNYILRKHSALYKDNFPETIDNLINKLKKEEAHRKRNEKKFEYRVGYFLLSPVRMFRNLF